MRVISVPGRLVLHPVTLRVIDDRGIAHDPHDLAIAQLIAHGDLALVEDEPEAPKTAPGKAKADDNEGAQA
jgi:hypothetical protein